MIGFTYSHTHCYLLRSNDREKLLAFDAGWPCSLLEYARGVKAAGYRFDCIRWAIISHFHLDHAGLVRDFQDAMRGAGVYGGGPPPFGKVDRQRFANALDRVLAARS